MALQDVLGCGEGNEVGESLVHLLDQVETPIFDRMVAEFMKLHPDENLDRNQTHKGSYRLCERSLWHLQWFPAAVRYHQSLQSCELASTFSECPTIE